MSAMPVLERPRPLLCVPMNRPQAFDAKTVRQVSELALPLKKKGYVTVDGFRRARD